MEIVYEMTGRQSLPDLSNHLDELWVELLRDGAMRDEATAQGLDLSSLPAARKDAFSLQRRGSGITGAEVAVVFLPLAYEVAKDVWTLILLPRLRRKFGEDSLEEARRS